MDRFKLQKADVLSRKDHSKKGSIDKHIKPLIDAINSLDNFYTTSSCAGRIDLLEVSDAKRKDLSSWLYITHEKAEVKKFLKALKNIQKNEIWFKMESAIIHICCKTLDDANLLLDMAKSAGFKHSGILSISKRIILEIFGSEKIETIIAKKGHLLVDTSYIKHLVDSANKKLKETRKKIKNLTLKCLDYHRQHNTKHNKENQC